ncbi:hypothetical protein, partial [Mesorhizobium sp. M7A.F.Ca.CA.002.05.1.1]|uniref:hypothetical protein n=1 Tax=Mesorhizobium sp. M7A.F.Ca.CA.002.05.1.1 TaxID=2496704 RepID=UPI003FA57BC6
EESSTRQGSGKAGGEGGTSQEACSEGCGETRSEEGSTCKKTGCQGCTCQGCTGQEAGCESCSGKEGCGSEIFSTGEESGTCGQAEGSTREGRQEVVASSLAGGGAETVKGGCPTGAPFVVWQSEGENRGGRRISFRSSQDFAIGRSPVGLFVPFMRLMKYRREALRSWLSAE